MSYKKLEYKSAITSAVRSCRALGFGVRADPFSEENVHVERPARRPVELQKWLVVGDLCSKVIEEYVQLTPGTVRQLIAGTSRGKSTQVPAKLAAAHSLSVLCAMHEDPSPDVTSRWVADQIAAAAGVKGRVGRLTQEVVSRRQPMLKPQVLYLTVADLLTFYCANPKVIDELGVDIILVDECHVKRPEYITLKYMVALELFKTTRVMYMSATGSSDRTDEINSLRTVSKVPAMLLPSSPDALTGDSAAHFSRITDKTIVFLATDSEYTPWEEYYSDHDIPVLSYKWSSGTAAIGNVFKFLRENPVCVVLGNEKLRISWTFDLHTVLELGYTQVQRIDQDNGVAVVRITREPVTQSSLTQALGRVGRFRAGNAVHADVKCSPPVEDTSPEIACYVYLWCRLLRINVRDNTIAQFHGPFGRFSRRVIASMLTSPIHPLLLISYFGDEGPYRPFLEPLRAIGVKFGTGTHDMTSDDDVDQRVVSWDERDLRVDFLLDGAYRSKTQWPESFAILAYHLWASWAQEDGSDMQSEVGTVVGDVVVGRKITTKRNSRRPAVIMDTISEATSESSRSNATPRGRARAHSGVYHMMRSDSVATAYTAVNVSRPDLSTQQNRVDEVPPLPGPTSSLQRLRVPSAIADSQTSSNHPAVSVQTLPKYTEQPPPVSPIVSVHHKPTAGRKSDSVHRVEKWRRESVSSSSADEADEMKLKITTAVHKCGEPLFPMDIELRRVFMANPAVTLLDTRNVEMLLKSQSYAQLSSNSNTLKELQREYFLSLMRVYKATISDLLQSSVMSSGILKRFANRKVLEERVRALAQLIDVCFEHGPYAVGYRVKSKHASIAPSSRVSYTALDRSAAEGALALARSTEQVRRTVEQLTQSAVRIMNPTDEFMLGNGFYLCNRLVTAAHVVDGFTAEALRRYTGKQENVPLQSHDVVVFDTVVTGANVIVRQPIEGETVSLIGQHSSTDSLRVYGLLKLSAYLEYYTAVATFFSSMSGSLIVAHSDGAVVGMYVGTLGVIGENNAIQVQPFVL